MSLTQSRLYAVAVGGLAIAVMVSSCSSTSVPEPSTPTPVVSVSTPASEATPQDLVTSITTAPSESTPDATFSFVLDSGDAMTSTVTLDPLVPLSAAPAEVQACMAPLSQYDPTRSLAFKASVVTTLTSSLPGNMGIAFRLMERSGVVGQNATAIVMKSDGPACPAAGEQVSDGSVGWTQVAPQYAIASDIWFVLPDAITPNHPNGDPEKLGKLGLVLTASTNGTQRGKAVGSKLAVCDNAGIGVRISPDFASGCGGTQSLTYADYPPRWSAP
jgi:hypothetical protein